MGDVIKHVVWREATPADHDAILRLDPGGGAYDVGDYLPERLRDYLSDPQTYCTIGVLGDKVVTFDFWLLIDDGETILGRAVRSDKAYRSHGFWKQARYESVRNALKHFKEYNVTKVLGCTSGLDRRMTAAFRNPTIPVVRNYFHLRVKAGANKHHLFHDPSLLIRHIDLDECRQITSNRLINWKLFPNSYVLIGREPFKTLPNNSTRMLKYCKAVFGSFNHHNENDPGSLETISFGSGFQYKDTFVYEVDLYSSRANSEEAVIHFLTHVPVAQSLAGQSKLIMTPFLPMKFAVHDVLNELIQNNQNLTVLRKPAKHFLFENPTEKYFDVVQTLAKL